MLQEFCSWCQIWMLKFASCPRLQRWRMACTRLFAYGSRSRTTANAQPAIRHILFHSVSSDIVPSSLSHQTAWMMRYAMSTAPAEIKTSRLRMGRLRTVDISKFAAGMKILDPRSTINIRPMAMIAAARLISNITNEISNDSHCRRRD
jgi:hypothetical protein